MKRMSIIAAILIVTGLGLAPVTGFADQEAKGKKYVMTWWERPGGAAADYERAQKRVLHLFQSWKMPESLKFHQFLVRVGEFGGYAVIETDKPGDIHKLTTAFAVFQFRVEPVMDVMDAVAAESEAIGWRDSVH